MYFFLLLLISLFSFSFSDDKDIEIEVMTVEQFYEEINANNKLNNETYTKIAHILASYLSNYYYYYSFTTTKGFSTYYINLYSKINYLTSNNNITNYIDFFNYITKNIFIARDPNLNVVFKNMKEYNYFIPFEFYFKTENQTNNLYIRLSENTYFKNSYNDDFIQSLKNISNKIITKINGKDPITYIQRFIQNSFFRDFYQSQFSFHLKIISTHSIFFEFNRSVFKNIKLSYNDNGKIQDLYYDYKIYKIKNLSSEFKQYYYEERKKYDNTIFEPSVFEFYERYKIEKNLMKDTFWDLNYKNMIKLKLHEKANVIYQNDFNFKEKEEVDIFGKIMDEMSKNDNPIIIIQSGSFGGSEYYASIFEKILNYNISNPRIKVSYRIPLYNKYYIKSKIHYDLKTCSPSNPIYKEIIENIPNYNKTHNRTDILLLYNSYLDFEKKLDKYNFRKRKPTDILIYTDGINFGAGNILIQNIKNEGKAIIVGYSGNPSYKFTKYDINGSSPSISEDIMNYIDDDNDNFQELMKYNISLRLSVGALYEDDYQNKNNFTFPYLYKKKKIDERSRIYNYYTDEQFNDFLNEGLEIINKYKTSCNKENENLLLYDEKCFNLNNDGITHGGLKCINNTWSNICVPAYCSQGYFFDTEKKECIKDQCKQFYSYTYISLIISLIIFIVLVGFLIFKFFVKGGITSDDIGRTFLN